MSAHDEAEALIEEVRRLDAAATAGPWRVCPDERDPQGGEDGFQLICCGVGDEHAGPICTDLLTSADAALIARFRTLAPKLADALEATERRLAEVERLLDRAGLLIGKAAIESGRREKAIDAAEARAKTAEAHLAEAQRGLAAYEEQVQGLEERVAVLEAGIREEITSLDELDLECECEHVTHDGEEIVRHNHDCPRRAETLAAGPNFDDRRVFGPHGSFGGFGDE